MFQTWIIVKDTSVLWLTQVIEPGSIKALKAYVVFGPNILCVL